MAVYMTVRVTPRTSLVIILSVHKSGKFPKSILGDTVSPTDSYVRVSEVHIYY